MALVGITRRVLPSSAALGTPATYVALTLGPPAETGTVAPFGTAGLAPPAVLLATVGHLVGVNTNVLAPTALHRRVVVAPVEVETLGTKT